ncbi:hypothetical protein CCH79_00002315 [Gambusia affinis]|uniref:Ribosomal RNA-processing protein 43 n=1 Tax=Gambusia affinis TaxID=33528 RepID=A0A315VII2_GAMAF|nr:hypothetical protein CCH79_00002315 [Gambusia affinis]
MRINGTLELRMKTALLRSENFVAPSASAISMSFPLELRVPFRSTRETPTLRQDPHFVCTVFVGITQSNLVEHHKNIPALNGITEQNSWEHIKKYDSNHYLCGFVSAAIIDHNDLIVHFLQPATVVQTHVVNQNIMATGFKIAEPLEYHRSFLKENCRPDGRELSEFRTTTLNIGSISTADGSALVKIGNTTIICGIKAELANPTADAPGKGYIGKYHKLSCRTSLLILLTRFLMTLTCSCSVPNVDLPPLCSSRFRPGPPGEQAQAASQFIADIIESSEVIKAEDLCVDRGKLCWVLYCDIMCLDYDGNILDACIIALLAALKNTQLPEVTVNKETCSPEVNLEKRQRLHIHKHPASASFCVFDDSILIVDPTAEEESLSTAHLTVVTDEEGRLCSVHKPGGTSLSGEKLQDCINRATARQREIHKLIDKVLDSVKTTK